MQILTSEGKGSLSETAGWICMKMDCPFSFVCSLEITVGEYLTQISQTNKDKTSQILNCGALNCIILHIKRKGLNRISPLSWLRRNNVSGALKSKDTKGLWYLQEVFLSKYFPFPCLKDKH